MTLANPIYDVVFKFLMDDPRVARIILSALLKKDIVAVEMRPHEYSGDKRTPEEKRRDLSVFRIDFAATVREVDGTEHLVLVELQKTWVPTETLRFRQYLGFQYASKHNVVGEGRDQHALPMVAIYLLGHRVGDIEEPVFYVNKRVLTPEGEAITKGVPNDFVDSLTHESIFVQIPLLRGRVNSRLYEVLSIFDQTHVDSDDQHLLHLDEDYYRDDDGEMQRVVRRLLMAASDSAVRHEMNVEDEYFSLIEEKDTDIAVKERKIKEMGAQLEKKDAMLEQQNAQLKQQNAQIEQQYTQLEQKDAQLEQQYAQLEQKDVQLRKSIAKFAEMGLTPQLIADITGVSAEDVTRILK